MATAVVGSVTEYDSSNSYSAAVNKPADVAAGDLLIAIISRNKNAAPVTVPSGWALLASSEPTAGYKRWIYYKIVTSSDPSSYTWEWDSGQAGKTRINIIAYRGNFSASTPIESYSNTLYTTSDSKLQAATISVASANQTILVIGSLYNTSAASFTKPSSQDNNWTEDYDGGNANSDFYHGIYRAQWSSSGLTGAMEITTSLSNQTNKHAFGLVLTLENKMANQPEPCPDCQIYSGAPNTNYDTEYNYTQCGRDGANADCFYLTRADFSKLPAGATIVSAYLYLYQMNGGNTGTLPMKVNRILSGNSDWVNSQATWNNRKTGTGWAGSAGCKTSGTDFSSTDLGSFSFTGTTDKTGYAVSLDATELALMIANNYGLIIRHNNGTNQLTKNMYNSNADIPYRPKIIVAYTTASSEIVKVCGIELASLSKYQGIAKASIKKINCFLWN